MSTSDLSSLAIPEGALQRSSNWALQGSIVWGSSTRGQGQRPLIKKLNHQLLRVEAVARSTAKQRVKDNWYRAGVAHCYVGNSEAHSEGIPLGQSYVVFPLAGQTYSLQVWPRQYLPNLKVKVWAYTGPINAQAPNNDRLVQLIEQLSSEYNAS